MFCLFANCNFVPDHYDAWQEAFDQLAEYVWPNEPTTMTYYFGIPLDYAHDVSKTTSMFAFEVYGTREDLYETHIGSEPMKQFMGVIPQHSTTGLELNHYNCLGGFLDRDGDKEGCTIMQDIRIVCKSAEGRASVNKRLEALTASVLTSEKAKSESQDSGVLTFMAFECLDNDLGARLFGRFESREAMEQFIRREDVLEFWRESNEDVASMETRNYVPNGKGWLHRGGDDVLTGKAI